MTLAEGNGENKVWPELTFPKDMHGLLKLSPLYRFYVCREEVSEEELKKGYEKLVWIAQKAKRGLEISASVASGKGFSADIDAARMADLIGIGLLEEESPDSGEVLIKTNVIENWVNWEQGKPEAWTPQIKDFTEVRRLIKFAFENPDWYEDRVLGLALEKAERVRKTEV